MRKSNNKSLKNAIVAVIVLLLLCVATGLLVTFLKNGSINVPSGGDKPDDITPAEAASLYLFDKKVDTSSDVNIYLGQNAFTLKNVSEWNVSLSVTKDAKFDYVADDKYYSFTYSDFVKSFEIVKRENTFSISVDTVFSYIAKLRNTSNIVLPENVNTPNIEMVMVLTADNEKFEYAVKMDLDHYPVTDVTIDSSKVVF